MIYEENLNPFTSQEDVEETEEEETDEEETDEENE